jgi:hypothetical protein
MGSLLRKIETELERIPELMVKKAIFNMRKSGGLMVDAEVRQFEETIKKYFS